MNQSNTYAEEINEILKNILNEMNEEYNLVDLCEYISNDVKDKFPLEYLREVIEECYPSLPIEDRIFLFKHINLQALNMHKPPLLIHLPDLFNYLEKILREKIYSPTLILYDIAETIEHKRKVTTLEFIYSVGLTVESIINVNEFFTKISRALELEDIISVMLFKGLDYNNKGKIKIEDFLLVIDSYREDLIENETIQISPDDYNKEMMKVLFLKHYMTIDELYSEAQYNYLDYDQLRAVLFKEFINELNAENIIDYFLYKVDKNKKIFKDDVAGYISLPPSKSDIEKTDSNVIEAEGVERKQRLITPKGYVKLTEFQSYWINKYLNLIACVNITAKMAFEFAISKRNYKVNESTLRDKDDKENIEVVNLEELKRKMKILLPTGSFTAIEMNNMCEALNINKNHMLDYNQYSLLITSLRYENQLAELGLTNTIVTHHSCNNIPTQAIPAKAKGSLYNRWVNGVKSTTYHLLPVKGNGTVLSQLRKDLRNNLQLQINNQPTKDLSKPIFVMNPQTYHSQSVDYSIPTRTPQTKTHQFIIEDTPMIGDQSANNNTMEHSKSRVKVKAIRMQIEAPTLINTSFPEYKDDFDIIKSLETFNTSNVCFPSYDLCTWLILGNGIVKEKAAKIIRTIDGDVDGFISLKDTMEYLLKVLRHRSTKIVLKYLYLKIYKELRLTIYDFFIKNSIDLQKEINSVELGNYLTEVNVNRRITKKLYDEMIVIFPSPLIYKHFAELIEAQEEYIREGVVKIEKREIKDKNEIDTDYERTIREIVHELANNEGEYVNSEILMARNLRENIGKLLINTNGVMNYTQFHLFFLKPLEIDHNLGRYLFDLLSIITSNGERIIYQSELCLFLESYIEINNEENHDNDDGIKNQKQSTIEGIIKNIESNGPSINKPFEQIKFSPSGKIPINNIMSTLVSFYPNQPRHNLINLLKTIDTSLIGYVSYADLHLFLNSSPTKVKYSIDLEIKHIASTLYQKSPDLLSSKDYFCTEANKNKIKNYSNITKQEHNKLFSTNLCSSNTNKDSLFDYLCQRQGSRHGYSIESLCNMIDSFIHTQDTIVKSNTKLYERILDFIPKQNIQIICNALDQDQYFSLKPHTLLNNKPKTIESQSLPSKTQMEEVLNQYVLGSYGKISIIDFVRKFNTNTCDRRAVSTMLDTNQCGYIDYVNFIYSLRNAYGNSINLNVQLCAKYMFIEHIKEWSNIEDWVLSIAKTTDVRKMLTHDLFCSSFIFGFAYDKMLFETFYFINKEKKGDKKGLVSLESLVKFIQCHNQKAKPEIKKTFNKSQSYMSMKSSTAEYIYNNNMNEAEENEYDEDEGTDLIPYGASVMSPDETLKVFLIEYEKKTMPIKSIINMLNYDKMKLRPDYTISQNYLQSFLQSPSIKINPELIDLMTSLFKVNDEDNDARFNLRVFCEFIRMYCPKSSCDISSDIIPKLKKQIQLCTIKNFKAFIQKYFKKDMVDITEFVPAIEYFKVSLYESIILTRNEDDHISIEELFTEHHLKELFKTNEIDTSLRSVLKNLSNYFETHKDKHILFKRYDLDKNGFIGPDEFITALNSIKEISINDNQKMAILKIADKDRDGRINPKEFLMFIKTIRTNDNYQDDNKVSQYNTSNGLNSSLPKVPVIINHLYQQIIATTTAVQSNLEYNKKCHKETKDPFLGYMIALQQDYINTFSGIDSMEQDFLFVDDKKIGYVSYEKFILIVKKKVLVMNKEMIEKMIDLAHLSLGEKIMVKNVAEKRVKYMNFIQNIINYRYEFMKEKESAEGNEIRFGEENDGNGDMVKGLLPAVVLAGKKRGKTKKKSVTIVNEEEKKKKDDNDNDEHKEMKDDKIVENKPLEVLANKIEVKEDDAEEKALPVLSDQLVNKEESNDVEEKPLPLLSDELVNKEEANDVAVKPLIILSDQLVHTEKVNVVEERPLPVSSDLILDKKEENVVEEKPLGALGDQLVNKEEVNDVEQKPLGVLSDQLVNKEKANDVEEKPLPLLSDQLVNKEEVNDNAEKPLSLLSDQLVLKEETGDAKPIKEQEILEPISNDSLISKKEDKKVNNEDLPLPLLASEIIHSGNDANQTILPDVIATQKTSEIKPIEQKQEIISSPSNNDNPTELLSNKLQSKSQPEEENKPLELLGGTLITKEGDNLLQKTEEEKQINKEEPIKEKQANSDVLTQSKPIDNQTNNEPIELLSNKLINTTDEKPIDGNTLIIKQHEQKEEVIKESEPKAENNTIVEPLKSLNDQMTYTEQIIKEDNKNDLIRENTDKPIQEKGSS